MKKALPIIIGLVVFAGLLGGYFVLKQGNEAAEREAAETDIVYSYDTADITALTLDNEAGEIVLVRTGDTWSCESDAAVTPDADLVTTLLDLVHELEQKNKLADVEDLSAYGLSSPVCTVSFTAADTTVSLAVGNYNAVNDSQYVYLDGDSSVVYAVSQNLTTLAQKTAADLVAESTTEE